GVQHGYNTLFGNERLDDLSSHPNIKKQFKQTDGQVKNTTAAGRYQFLKDTWDGVAKDLGLKDFSPKNQDIAAVALLAQNGALPSVLKGDFKTAVQKSG
ncbi:glycoside hydrolase family protein, partial [Acinetobacter baumannii]